MPPGFKPIQITVFPVQSSVSTTSGHALLSLVRQSSSHAKTTSPCLHLCIGNVGDTIVVTLNNKLGNETTSLHWHGLYQAGSNANDGPPMVTQCPILPGQSYTYTFRVSSSVTVTRMILTTSPKVGPTRYILVSFSLTRPIRRRSSRTAYHSRSKSPICW